jgi:2-haloacid dehalogenase/putative hydrolase of the HAD superfamily
VVDALLLDFYGTVVGSDDVVIAGICEQVATTAGVPAPAAGIARAWWESFARACEATGRGFTGQRAAARASLIGALRSVASPADPDELLSGLVAHWRRPPPLGDAQEFLARLDVPVCIVSNIDRADLDAALRHHGLAFDHVVASDDVRSYKPRPEMFRRAMAHLGVEPGDVVHAGDSLSSDVAGANGVGIAAAWVNRSGRPRPAGTRLWAEVADLTALADRLDAGPPRWRAR